MKKIIISLFAAFSPLFLGAYEVPEGYYDNASGRASRELKTALHQIIKGGVRLDYGSGQGATWSGFEKTDRHPEGYCWDMYSYHKRNFPGNATAPGGMNIEHSVAKSWWGGHKNNAYKDLYHLNPSDSHSNSSRGNYPLGVVTNGKTVGSLKIGDNTYGTEFNGQSFEPLDEYKGDFARAYLYMFTAYEDLNWSSNSSTMLESRDTYPMLRPWAAQMLVEWSRMDPPSEKEITRAAEVYKLQKNRNPFIDHPDLVEYLWGDKKGEPYFFSDSTDPIITHPSYGSTCQFETIHYESTTETDLKIMGRNLTSAVQIAIEGDVDGVFSLSTQTVSAEEAIAGHIVTVYYTPNKAVTSTATLTVASEGAKTRTIQLEATATENFQALAPSQITSGSFVANWTKSSLTTSFSLEVYRKEIHGEEHVLVSDANFAGKLPTGWTQDGYVGFTDGDRSAARLGSGSNHGTLKSPAFSLEKGGKIEIRSKQWAGDGQVFLRILFGTKEVAKIEVHDEYDVYNVVLPEVASTEILSVRAEDGKRAYVSDIKIFKGGLQIEEIPLDGYPMTLSSIYSHTIEGLNPNSEYFYRVTPQLETGVHPTSEEMAVTTSDVTSVEDEKYASVVVYTTNGKIFVKNIETATAIHIINFSGQILAQESVSSSEYASTSLEKGQYILQILFPEQVITKKILVQ